jgi:hypothetical protein
VLFATKKPLLTAYIKPILEIQIKRSIDYIGPTRVSLLALLLVVVLIGFALGFYLLPQSVGWFISGVLLTALGVLLFAPKWIR